MSAALFALALLALAYRARRRQGFGPFALGTASVASVLVFKFAYVFDPLVYAGLFGFIGASPWNAWPKAKGAIGRCPERTLREHGLETKQAS